MSTMTNERPILFSTGIVRAILDRRKTQTRRVIKPQPEGQLMYCYAGSRRGDIGKWHYGDKKYTPPCHGDDVLWVRETWCMEWVDPDGFTGNYLYRADGIEVIHVDGPEKSPWRPSIHMPREAARLFLRVKRVSVERLQVISEVDAIAEGLACLTKDSGITYKYGIPDSDGLPGNADYGWHWTDWSVDPRKAFRRLWDSLSAKRGYGWDTDPWVWVIEFERMEDA